MNALLKQFTANVLDQLKVNDDHTLWDVFDDVYESMEELQDDDAVDALVGIISPYISEITFREGGASFLIGSQDDSEHDCIELVEELAPFLLPQASDPYLLLTPMSLTTVAGIPVSPYSTV